MKDKVKDILVKVGVGLGVLVGIFYLILFLTR